MNRRTREATIREKVLRLERGARPRVLEFCSGCGGLSLGLEAAGFSIDAFVDSSEDAVRTHVLNIGSHAEIEAAQRTRDMRDIRLASLLKDFQIDSAPANAFDVLAGGLPCQAYSRVGRSKLASLAGDQHAHIRDPRASLYVQFLAQVERCRPVAVLLENVPDILYFGGRSIPEEICASLERIGYQARYTVVNAAFYGVPQFRERLFILALDSSLGLVPCFPPPSHYIDIPVGYEHSRRSLANLAYRIRSQYITLMPLPSKDLGPAVSAREALRDLPEIREHLTGDLKPKQRSISEILPYKSGGTLSVFAQQMRAWRKLPSLKGTDGHVIRITPRDFDTFEAMPQGAEYPEAKTIAENLFEDALRALAPRHRPRPGTKKYASLRARYVPPYDAAKFPNRWWKMEADTPSRTLTAHLGRDTYSHIHYDDRQRRMISVREAARLQSFPDGFRFMCSMNSAFSQIGNAVPPLLAKAIAESLRSQLRTLVRVRASKAA